MPGGERVFPSSELGGRRDALWNVWCLALCFKRSFPNCFECHENY